eukprot:344443-Pelagomonas_calceolata.AAC.1
MHAITAACCQPNPHTYWETTGQDVCIHSGQCLSSGKKLVRRSIRTLYSGLHERKPLTRPNALFASTQGKLSGAPPLRCFAPLMFHLASAERGASPPSMMLLDTPIHPTPNDMHTP